MPIVGERLRIVLDTNVLGSGLNYTGTPNRLLRLLSQGEIDWFISPFILEELHRVLTEKFLWEEDRSQRALRLIREVATKVGPPRGISVIQAKDDDNRILECALQAKAHYLVSGDRRHVVPLTEFKGVSIVTPAEFMELVLRNRTS